MPINKLKEMFVARRLERVHSKDDLINLYLNTVPFGVNIYGVQVAAKQFFDTNAKDIRTEEAAVLVGMLKANTYYNPVRNPKNALSRRNTVLRQMKKLRDFLYWPQSTLTLTRTRNSPSSKRSWPLPLHWPMAGRGALEVKPATPLL